MKLDLPFSEALALAASQAPLPDVVSSLTCSGSTIHADIDLRAIPTGSTARRLAFAAAGVITVTTRIERYAAGVATLAVTAHTRGLPAHKLLPYLLDPIDAAVARAGLPDGVVKIEPGETDPVVEIDVQKAVDRKVSGLTVTALSLTDAVIHAEADVGEFRVL